MVDQSSIQYYGKLELYIQYYGTSCCTMMIIITEMCEFVYRKSTVSIYYINLDNYKANNMKSRKYK